MRRRTMPKRKNGEKKTQKRTTVPQIVAAPHLDVIEPRFLCADPAHRRPRLPDAEHGHDQGEASHKNDGQPQLEQRHSSKRRGAGKNQ